MPSEAKAGDTVSIVLTQQQYKQLSRGMSATFTSKDIVEILNQATEILRYQYIATDGTVSTADEERALNSAAEADGNQGKWQLLRINSSAGVSAESYTPRIRASETPVK